MEFTPEQLQQIRQLIVEVMREESNQLFALDKFIFRKQLRLEELINIQLGTKTGTKIGTEATQKLALYGVTPIIQQDTFTVATTGAVQDAGARDNIASIKTILTNIGITN